MTVRVVAPVLATPATNDFDCARQELERRNSQSHGVGCIVAVRAHMRGKQRRGKDQRSESNVALSRLRIRYTRADETMKKPIAASSTDRAS
jgi:hypothetical protein